MLVFIRRAAILLGCLVPALALAVPAHMDIKVKATAKGCKITCVVRSDNASFTQAHVGLVAPGSHAGINRQNVIGLLKPSKVATAPFNQAVPVEIDVEYGQGHNAGDQVRVISAWPGNGSVHVFGAVTSQSPDHVLTLPPLGKQ